MQGLKRIAIIAGATVAVPIAGLAAVGTAIAIDAESTTATVTRVIDGDTIETTAGPVRLIGIDTPEEGQCGYEAATAALGAFAPVGSTVTLEHPGLHSDTDRYNRLLRYVATPEGDAGLHQIEGEWADARYDSTDGYPYHEKEDEYRAADTAKWQEGTVACPAEQAPAAEDEEDTTVEVVATHDDDEDVVPSPAPKPAAPAPVKPAPAPVAQAPTQTEQAAPEAPSTVYYENCSAVRAAGAAPLYIGQPGYSTKLDRDKDGVACES